MDSIAAQAKALGLPPGAAVALHGQAIAAAPAEIEVHPENWPAVRLFIGLGTQWRRAGMAGVPTGLDYAAIPAVAGMLGLTADEDLLRRLRVLETEALDVMLSKRPH